MRAVLSLHGMTSLASIHIYPLKSGAPLALDEAVVEKRGLARDRRWMLVDANGKFVTGRQVPRLTLIRAQPLENGLRLSAPDMPDIELAAPTTGARIESAVWGAPVKPLLADDAAHDWISAYMRAPHRLVHMSVIIAGDAQQFADALGKAYPKSERYTIGGLDLDSPTLKPAPK